MTAELWLCPALGSPLSLVRNEAPVRVAAGEAAP